MLDVEQLAEPDERVRVARVVGADPDQVLGDEPPVLRVGMVVAHLDQGVRQHRSGEALLGRPEAPHRLLRGQDAAARQQLLQRPREAPVHPVSV